MLKILDNWKRFLNESKVLKEIHHIDAIYLPDEFINGLPQPVRDNIRQYDTLDFDFQRYKQVDGLRDQALTKIPNKFFAPYVDKTGSRKEQFFDFSHDDEDAGRQHVYARDPSPEELAERGKTIPVLPDKWYNAFLNRLGEPIIETKKNKRNLDLVKTLAVFDFDETLFKSDKAAERLRTDSHLSPDSLPDNPTDSDWNLDVVYKAQELCSNPTVYCVMMTGRVGNVFEEKINKMLEDKRIFFAETFYNEFGGDTVKYKTEEIYNLISKLPNASELIMWEDQEDKAEKYQEEFGNKYFTYFKIHMVGQDDKD